jgi:hypothetical protein
MVAVVDLRELGFLVPHIERVVERFTPLLHGEVDVHGRAAECCRFVPNVKIVVAVCAAEGQVKVRVYVDTTGQQVFATAIHDFVTGWIDVAPNERYDFTFD